MEQKFQTSFIPKKESSKNLISKVKRPTTIFNFIAMALFVLSILAILGLFVYGKFFLAKQIEAKKMVVQEEIKAFDPEFTRTLTALKDRIDSGGQLLSKHVAVSRFLTLLESLTAQSVSFSELEFTVSPGERGLLSIQGVAPNYSSLAFQSSVLDSDSSITDLTFVDINLNDQGRIDFSLEAQVERPAHDYQFEAPQEDLEEEEIPESREEDSEE